MENKRIDVMRMIEELAMAGAETVKIPSMRELNMNGVYRINDGWYKVILDIFFTDEHMEMIEGFPHKDYWVNAFKELDILDSEEFVDIYDIDENELTKVWAVDFMTDSIEVEMPKWGIDDPIKSDETTIGILAGLLGHAGIKLIVRHVMLLDEEGLIDYINYMKNKK